ncbi:MAG: gliding motility protein GldL [Paludibacteraceae bacterium]
MKLRKPNSSFYRWWNSYTGRRMVSAAYSLGASVVILGAMFKILHLPVGNIMLGVGMTVESIIFALGIFDKPYREYDWSKIFNFKGKNGEKLDTSAISAALSGSPISGGMVLQGNVNETDFQSVGGTASSGGGGTIIIGGGGGGTGGGSANASSGVVGNGETGTDIRPFNGLLAEDDVQKLSEGIKNLSTTAENLQALADIALAANGLAKHIESASETAANFAETQQKLNTTAETLASSYQNVNSEMDQVVSSTRNYSGNVDTVNRSIASINSIYEIQLRHIQTQTENLNRQADAIRKATENVDGVATDMDKMREAANAAQLESQRYQTATRKLAKQVEDLNAIYGNMLNALS